MSSYKGYIMNLKRENSLPCIVVWKKVQTMKN